MHATDFFCALNCDLQSPLGNVVPHRDLAQVCTLQDYCGATQSLFGAAVEILQE